jgi:Flp pilus assembly protein TadD
MRNRFQTSLKARQAHAFFAVTVVMLAKLPGLGAQNCPELVQRAQELLAQDMAKEALEPLKKATEVCPTNSQAYDLLGIAYDMQNRYKEAQQAHRKAIALSPNWPPYRNNLAISYAHDGKRGEAKIELKTALRLDPHNLIANSNLADFCLQEKQYRQALEYLRNVRAEQSDDPTLAYALAQAYFGAGETELALGTVARLSALTPGNEKMRFGEGLLLAEHHQYSEAVKQFEAIPVGDRDFAVCQNLGLAYSRLHRHEEAQSAFEQALRLDPSNPEPYFAIGMDMLDGRTPEQAVYPLTQAHQKAPERVDIACALAEALLQTRQLVQSGNLLAEVRAKAPNDAAVSETEGDLYVAEGEDAKALESYRRALQLNPGNLSIRLPLAKAYLRLDQTAPAKGEFEKILEGDLTNAEAHAGLGRIALRAGQEYLALRELSAALQQDPNELEANEDLAAIKVRRDEFVEARGILERLVRLDPENARYHYQLGRVLLKLGKAAEAQQEFARSEKIEKAK